MPDVTVSTDIDALLKSADDTAARAELGVAIGTDVQAHSAALDAVTGTNTGDQDLSGLQPKPSEGQFVDGDKTKLDSISGSPITTKGDLYTFDTDEQRLPLGADGTHLVADSAEATGLKWVASQNNNNVNSTGLLTGGILTVGGGASEYSISDGTGQIVTQTGDKTLVSWTGKANITPTNIATQLISFVGLDVNGDVVEQSSPFTALQSRSIIILGVIVHVDNANVDAVNTEAHPAYNVMSQLHDLGNAIGFFNQNGNLFAPNGANLNIDKTSGTIFKMGSNYDVDPNAPHSKSLGSLTAASFQYRFSNGSNGVTGIAIDPDNIDDNAGGLTALSNNEWSVQRIYSFISNNVKIQRGAASYGNKADAINGITTENYIVEPSIKANALLRGWLIVQEGATDLSDPAQAEFIEAPKFGSGGGTAGGASSVADDTAYGVSWDGNTDAATKNVLYDKIETLGGGGGGTVQGNDSTYQLEAATTDNVTTPNANGAYSVNLQTRTTGAATQTASGQSSTISGGLSNTASEPNSVVGGGTNNTASGQYGVGNSVVGGGQQNTASGAWSTVSGGKSNTASNYYSTVSGGNSNTASGYNGTISGGFGSSTNSTSGADWSNTIGGGEQNTLSGYHSTIAGGSNNTSSVYDGGVFIGGGTSNVANGTQSVICGGTNNTASGDASAILGGQNNSTNSLSDAMIVGSNITAQRANTLHCNNLTIKNIPTSATGLTAGDVWNDAGTLKIV